MQASVPAVTYCRCRCAAVYCLGHGLMVPHHAAASACGCCRLHSCFRAAADKKSRLHDASEALHLLVVSRVFSSVYLGFSCFRACHLWCGGAAASGAAIVMLATIRTNLKGGDEPLEPYELRSEELSPAEVPPRRAVFKASHGTGQQKRPPAPLRLLVVLMHAGLGQSAEFIDSTAQRNEARAQRTHHRVTGQATNATLAPTTTNAMVARSRS